jgi:hypothetical protein
MRAEINVARISPFQRLLLAIALAASVPACTTVLETATVRQVEGVACRASVGAYYLPKALVRISVGPAAAPRRGFDLNNDTPSLEWVADRRQMYCLDYLASPTSVDIIGVERTPTGLLTKVASNTDERSADIAIKLIDTAQQAAIAAFRSGDLDSAAAQSADIQFDPFDPRELKMVNVALRRFKMCVYIENHSFPEAKMSPHRWCSDPQQDRYVNEFNLEVANTPIIPEAMNTGILYRPNATHKLVIRRFVGGREPWALQLARHVEVPNVSPVFSIGVYRAIFTTRVTELVFANGVLTNVMIKKGSELESFARVPLRLAQAIVDLPTQIIQVRINETSQNTTLAQNEAQLSQALRELADTRGTNAPRSTTLDRSALIQQCLDAGNAIDSCGKTIGGIGQ